ncbi:superoxide dismutase family protein [Winogradskyella sp. A3E31]|uniref:superoxide dismutase family protein n=1 Tax=Winogradskyella sp. A3E31 TaxID=3349637 RepID=UPI00398A5239
MKYFKIATSVLCIMALTACKNDNKEKEVEKEIEVEEVVEKPDSMDAQKLEITLEPKSDTEVSGTVTFKETNGKVYMMANLTGLDEGDHAIHIHETADCSSADGTSTGGHWNPTAQPHGKWGAAEGYHKGDIGNFTADANGNGEISMNTTEWCIGCDDENKNILGKAIIVHQGTDDFTSQPSGAAGTRISCGGIIQ